MKKETKSDERHIRITLKYKASCNIFEGYKSQNRLATTFLQVTSVAARMADSVATPSGIDSGFPNLALARTARWKGHEPRRLREWKRAELLRPPFALLDDPPEELRSKKVRK